MDQHYKFRERFKGNICSGFDNHYFINYGNDHVRKDFKTKKDIKIQVGAIIKILFKNKTSNNEMKIMKKLILIASILLLFGCTNKKNVTLTFDNQYKGLKPGHSTLADVFDKLGEPISKKKTSNGMNYYFKEVKVNFSGKNKKYLNTLTITADFSYICPNGVQLNENIVSVRNKLKESRKTSTWFYDNKQGIFYWHDGEKITKLVLAYQAFK